MQDLLNYALIGYFSYASLLLLSVLGTMIGSVIHGKSYEINWLKTLVCVSWGMILAYYINNHKWIF